MSNYVVPTCSLYKNDYRMDLISEEISSLTGNR